MAGKVNIPWFKIFTLGATLIGELTAAAQDGKISIEEALGIVAKICAQAGVIFDGTGAAFALKALDLILKAAADKKITVAELIAVGEVIAADLGVQLDKTGFTLPA
ncbi:MAG: hypothetical protein ABFD81_07105 [Syntrophaceae bacterium]